MRLRVIDIETTGVAPPAEIIEIGRVDVVGDGPAWRVGQPMSRLYRPLHGIPPETMAVHHITEDMVGGETPVCTDEKVRLAIWAGGEPDVLVAHNCDFERLFISDLITAPLPWRFPSASIAAPPGPSRRSIISNGSRVRSTWTRMWFGTHVGNWSGDPPPVPEPP